MSRKYYHKKLVRDKIPDIIRTKEGSFRTRALKINEFRKLLRTKLVEEAKELVDAKKDELVDEMVDVQQVIKSIAEFEKISFNKIEKARIKKEKEKGAFKKRIFLIWSDKSAGNE